MSNLDKEIGKRLRMARKARGYKSARSFASRYKIPESTYSQHETGKRSLNPELMMLYCERLDISPGWLVSGQDGSNVTLSQTKQQTVELLQALQSQTDRLHSINDSINGHHSLREALDPGQFKELILNELPKYVGKESQPKVLELINHCLATYNAMSAANSAAR